MAKTKLTDKELLLDYFFRHIAKNYAVSDRSEGFKDGYETNPHWRSSMAILEDRLARGWTIQTIRDRLLQVRDSKISCDRFSDAIPPIPPTSDSNNVNLLSDTEKYTHHALKIVVPPEYDEDTGAVISSGGVRRVKSFTLENLADYYVSELEPEHVDRKKLIGILRYLLSSGIELDVILQAIDLWRIGSTDRNRGSDPWVLESEWIPMAQADKDNALSISEDDGDEDVE